MTNMAIQPLWLTHFIKILLVLEFQLTKFIVGAFSYKAHFIPQISSNATHLYFAYVDESAMELCFLLDQLIGPSASMNTYPDLDFLSMLSPAQSLC